MMSRFGSAQVRASGTVGGNIANGSPIGDLAPALIALGASVELRKGEASREPAAGRFLHRLWQAGPRARRICARARRAAARRRPRLSRLQGLEAVRRGHFRGDGRVPPRRWTAGASRARASPMAAWRRRRSARADAEAALVGAEPRRSRELERGARRRSPTISRRSPTCARAPPIAARSPPIC